MKNRTILITGGTGMLARRLIEELEGRGAGQIRLFARSEAELSHMSERYPKARLVSVAGDIRDREALRHACAGVDVVFHLAAIKQVSICEKLPLEAVGVNVTGTQNVVSCAIESGVERVMYVSSNMAVNAGSVYGCTKLLGEKLVLSANEIQKQTRFMVFRLGNLLEKDSGLMALFGRQIAEQGKVLLTHEKMSRFFLTPKHACFLLVNAIQDGIGGEVFFPNMKALSVRDIALYLLKQNGLSEDALLVSGIRPGERLQESLLTEEEADLACRMGEELGVLCRDCEDSRLASGILVRCRDCNYNSGASVLPYRQAEVFLDSL